MANSMWSLFKENYDKSWRIRGFVKAETMKEATDKYLKERNHVSEENIILRKHQERDSFGDSF